MPIQQKNTMTNGNRVIVKALPERFVTGVAEEFFQEMKPLLRSGRPLIVFDFSIVRVLDSSGIEVLIRGLEEVMKRNGDLKLAAVPPAAAVVMELTGVDRFFETYETSSEAADSFYQLPVHALQQVRPSWRNAFQRADRGGEFEMAD
jgi:anti-anti-sigma factor